MRAYELMIIVDADVDDPGVQAVLDQVKDQIALRGGDVKSVDMWGRRRFAYEIDHKHEGTYAVLQFVAPGTGLDELERWHRLADPIVRHKLIRLPESEAAKRGLGQTWRRQTPADRSGAIDMADNSITVIGNITRDPELRFTNSGRPQVSFGLAVNRRYQQNGEWVEQTSFFNIVAWAQLAENVSESLGKGARVIVNGRLEQRSWETQDGEKRSVIEIVADEVGPSLRWATAKIERNERSSETGDRPRGGSGGGGGQSAPTESYGDEEPF